MDSPTGDEPATASRRNRVLVRKAVDCGVELLARLSNYRIYLSEKEYARKLSGPNGEDSMGNGGGGGSTPFEEGNNGNMTPVNSNQNGNSNSQWNSFNNGTIGSAHGSIGASSFLSVPITRPNNSNSPNGSNAGSRRSSVPNNAVSPTISTKFASGNNLDIAASGGVGGSVNRKREDSILSSRPGSTTSKSKKASSFFTSAKNLFSHSTFSSDRNAVATEDISDDSHELQLHMALTAGPISKAPECVRCLLFSIILVTNDTLKQ
jgi:hypothetical protein